VKRWVDYSDKYGVGYLLSNDSGGMLFNDSSKLIQMDNTDYFEYIIRKKEDKSDLGYGYLLNDYPKELKKKINLLKHFKTYLESSKVKPNLNNLSNQENIHSRDLLSSPNLVYIKKWMKTKHAIMFRLSNKIVQVDFNDKTKIILSSTNK